MSPPVDLVDRYVAEIRRYLPPGHREAVGRSVEDELRAQVRATEAHDGRPMTEEEIEALVRMRGHPYLIAQPYRTGRYLFIGPSLVPQYWRAVKTALTVTFLAVAAVTAVFAAAGTSPVLLVQYLSVFGQLAVPIVVIVTIGYAILDVVNGRLILKQPWDPHALPASSEAVARSTRGSFSDAVTSGLFLIWWLAVPHYPWVTLGPGAVFLRFSDAFNAAYLPVAVCFAAALVVHLLVVVRPGWTRLSRWRTLIANGFSVLGASFLVGAGDLLVGIRPDAIDAHGIEWINRAVRWCLVWTMAVGAFQTIRAFLSARRWLETAP